jgi:glucose/arabinose dehydrogenase
MARVLVAPLMAALILISVPMDWALAQTTACSPLNPPSNVAPLLPGYTITGLCGGLNFPTAMTFGRDGTIWVSEEGTASSPAAVKQIDNMGNVTIQLAATDLPAGTIVSPLTGIVFDSKRSLFWLIHRQTNSASAPGVAVGVISQFKPSDPKGTFQTVIVGFPSFGDHPNSQIVFDADGRAYVNGAAPTNSSVPGPDDGWLTSTTPPDLSPLSDFPGVNVELSGIGYRTLFPFRLDPNGGCSPPLNPPCTALAKITDPFEPFGQGPVAAWTVVKAPTPAHSRQVTVNNQVINIIAGGGTVYSFDPDAKDPTSTMRLEGWGFRNPYGIGFDPFNPKLLFVSNNGADVRQTIANGMVVIRGSRPIDNDYDDLFVINTREDRDNKRDQDSKNEDNDGRDNDGRRVPFFGHPDYFHDPVTRQPLPVTYPLFCPKGLVPPPSGATVVEVGQCSQFAFSDRFRYKLEVQPAFAELELHSSANMFDFSRSKAFGYEGDIFIAETGSFPRGTGATTLTGYKVARVDRHSNQVTDFVTHPDFMLNTIFPGSCSSPVATAFNKPIDVHIRGSEMFIVDFGVLLPADPAFCAQTLNVPNSGKIWKVTHQ